MKKSILSIVVAALLIPLCSTSYGQYATPNASVVPYNPSLTTNGMASIVKRTPSQVAVHTSIQSTKSIAQGPMMLASKKQLGKKFMTKVIPTVQGTKVVKPFKNQTQPRCLADEITNTFVQQQMAADPQYQKKMDAMKNIIQQAKQNAMYAKKVLKTVPVVVHVVHNPLNSNSPSENVSDQKIFNMINTLNEDFQRLNADASQTRAAFLSVAADAQIEFCLASKDPGGASTTGITRTVTAATYFTSSMTNDMKSTPLGIPAWDGTKYLNIWICNISNYAGFGIAGYAYLPSPGMHGSSIDGLVLDFDIGVSGRTPTHEIGHYFNLNHTWGSNPPSCSKDDGFTDTPNSGSEQYGCNFSLNTCGTTNGDQIENYMSYANCQNMFSLDQSAEMNSVLSTTRSSLLNSDGCEPTAPPVADFTSNTTTVVVGGNVNFTDLTTGLPDTWSWSFTGGTPNTSSVKNPSSIVYSTIGTYDVTLTATNSLGTNSITKTAYIDVIAVPPPPICGEPWVVWCEDFAGGIPVGWQNGQNAGTDAWIYSTTGPQGGFSIGPIASTTAANGYMLFDSDNLCSGTQDAYFYTVPINLSSYANVELEFQQWYVKWLVSSTWVSFSTNGTTWTDYEINNDCFSNNTATPNAETVSMNISADVGGSSTAYVKFTYTSTGGLPNGCDYAWMVDDIKIREIPPYDAEIAAAYFLSEYTLTPEKHITPLLLQAVVDNVGVNTVSNVGLAVNVYQTDLTNNVFTGSAPTLTTLGSGIDTVMTVAGGFTPTDTGFYITEYIVTISDSDGVPSNDTGYLTTFITDTVFARDNGATTGALWSGAGTPFIFGQSFGLEAPDYVNSITVSTQGQAVGDTIKLVIYDMVGGVPNTELGASAEYIMTAADTPAAILTLPINGGALSLAADTFFVGMSAYNKSGGTALGNATTIYTPGTIYGSIDGSALEPFGGVMEYQETFSTATISSDIALFNVDGLTPAAGLVALGFDNTNSTAWIMNGCLNAQSTSWYAAPAQSDDWLITPAISIGATSTLSWDAVATDPGFPDGYEVRISTSAQTVAGCLANAALFTIAAEDTIWTAHSVDLAAAGYTNQTIYIGFRNNSTDKNRLFLDNILVGIPSPLLASTFRSPFVLRPNFAQCNMTLTPSITAASCGACDGVGIVTPVDGFYPFTYTWNDPAAQTDSNATALCQGSYNVLVTDNNGCVATSGVTITDVATMSVSTTSTTESCSDGTGTAIAVVTGGTGPYTYGWDDPGTQANDTATALSAGTYNVTVTDAGGCTAETEFFSAAVVSNIPPPSTSAAG
ncbi:MAG: choice-of-anchor J domain-containing protein [Flavobacteriales bacterium]|nr:choice-of-anchor J domain-containing protein [Flavobacteriales bacterium]